MGDVGWSDDGSVIVRDTVEQVLDGASDALLRRLAALAYAGEELTALLLGTLGPGSRRYLQRAGALSDRPDERGRPRLTDRGFELCKLAAVRIVDRDLQGRVEQARSALSEAIARAERMEQDSTTSLRF
jgi:hypothetical protein